MSPIDQLKQQLINLSPQERMEVSNWLNDRVDEDQGTPEEIEAAWMTEIARRVKEIEDGTADLVPMDEVFAKAREKLDRAKNHISPAG